MAEIGTDISKATQLLRDGEVVAIPTETVYGLAANALNVEAVAQIFEVKQRPSFDPLIVHLASADELNDYCTNIPDLFYTLYAALSPGPVTYILPKTDRIPDLVTAGNPTVGIRFPQHALTRELLQTVDLPLAAPSANPFGYISPTTAQHVQKQLGNKIPYILDGGACSVGLESTIIDLSDTPKILRLGGMELSKIEAIAGCQLPVQTSSSNPKAPGMLSAHYAPKVPLYFGNVAENLEKHEGKKVAILSFEKAFAFENAQSFVLSPTGSLTEAATKLFATLRTLDESNFQVILAERFPDEGLGKAINDRLERAAFKE